MTNVDRMRAILSVKYLERNYTMFPVNNVQAVLLISADVELCLRIPTSGEVFENLLK